MGKTTIYASIEHSAPHSSFWIDIVGNVPTTQTIDGLGRVSPDYTLTPLVLKPHLSLFDPDSGVADPNGMKDATILIEELTDAGVKTITADTKGYTIATDAADKGQLTVNANTGKDRTIRMTVTYIDPLTGELITCTGARRIAVRSNASAKPKLNLSVPKTLPYYPLRDASDHKIKAMLTGGGKDWQAPTNCGFIWEKMDATTNKAWRRIYNKGEAGHNIMDYDVEISTDTSELTVHRNQMGDEMLIRCRAWYLDPQTNNMVGAGNGSTDALAPEAQTKLHRWFPDLTSTIDNVGWRLSGGAKVMNPTFKLEDTSIIPNPESEFDITWKAGAVGETLKEVGKGAKATISVDPKQVKNVAIQAVHIDKGSYKAALDSDGNVLTDTDGTPWIFR